MAWLGELIEQTCPTPPVLVGQLSAALSRPTSPPSTPERLDRLVLVVPFGLAPFQPSPEFGAALMGFLAEPREDTHDELWKHCVFDLDALRRQPDVRWESMKAYNLDLARTSTGHGGHAGAHGGVRDQPDFRRRMLAGIAVPTSLIWGRRDSIVPLSVGEDGEQPATGGRCR